MKKILILDNYDSFTYNLVHAIYDILAQEVDVVRNDRIEIDDVNEYDYIILSPGPGIPNEAGKLKEIIAAYIDKKKILGVCLGHQAIFEVMGGELENLNNVYHGVQTEMMVCADSSTLFEGIDESFKAGRYHSWVGNVSSIPNDLEITCKDAEGQIMAFEHKSFPVFGVQFHPESILTPKGNHILSNFLSL